MGRRRLPDSERSGPCPGREDEGDVRAGPRAKLPPTPEGQSEDAARLQGPIPPVSPSPGTSVCTSVNGSPITHHTRPNQPSSEACLTLETALTPQPPSAAVVPSGTAWAWNPTRQLRGRLGKDTISSHPGPKPPWHPLGTQETLHGQHALPSCALPRPLAFLTFGRTKPVPTQGLCICPLSAWHSHCRSPLSTSQHWSPLKRLTDLSAPTARVPAPGRPWPRRGLCLLAFLPSFLCSNHCPPDRVPLFMVCTSLPPSRLAGTPGRALSPVLCSVGHVAGVHSISVCRMNGQMNEHPQS